MKPENYDAQITYFNIAIDIGNLRKGWWNLSWWWSTDHFGCDVRDHADGDDDDDADGNGDDDGEAQTQRVCTTE